jgi:HSP20 family protein
MRIERYTYPNNRLAGWTNSGLSPWTGLEHEIDRLFSSAVSGLNQGRQGHQFAVALYEDRENAYVRAELPGINREEINVEMVDGSLHISAARKQRKGEAEESFSFSRTIGLSEDVQPDRVAATYENGILTVTLPKREEAKPKKVNIAVK